MKYQSRSWKNEGLVPQLTDSEYLKMLHRTSHLDFVIDRWNITMENFDEIREKCPGSNVCPDDEPEFITQMYQRGAIILSYPLVDSFEYDDDWELFGAAYEGSIYLDVEYSRKEIEKRIKSRKQTELFR